MKSLLLLILFSANTYAQYFKFSDDISQRSQIVMQEGFEVHEKLFDFFDKRPCEFGMLDSCDGPMSVADREELKSLIISLDRWRVMAYQDIMPEVNLLEGKEFDIKKGDRFNLEEKRRLNPLTLKWIKFLKITIADDQASKDFIQKTRIALSIDLLLYDSFFRLAEVLKKSKKMRTILEYDMPEEGKILERTYKIALNKNKWDHTKDIVELLEKVQKWNQNQILLEHEKYFEQYLQSSFIRGRILERDFVFEITTRFLLSSQMSQTRFLGAVEKFIGKLSKLFGNSVGKVQTRDGKMKKLASDPKIMNEFKQKLKPLYILLEKTPHRLTDKFIPGYFGHVALWMGNMNDLSSLVIDYQGKEIPFLDHPEVLPHLEAFSQGKLVLEALRGPGVTLNTLEHFMDIDDFVILETPSMDNKTMANYLLRAIRQIGKPYDFNFDVETDRSIVCSELIYTVFNDIAWPTDINLGRYTINPDHVAWKATDACFHPIELYIGGKRIQENLKEELTKVLSLPGGISYIPTGSCQVWNFASYF